jgi:hypothetical protein
MVHELKKRRDIRERNMDNYSEQIGDAFAAGHLEGLVLKPGCCWAGLFNIFIFPKNWRFLAPISCNGGGL